LAQAVIRADKKRNLGVLPVAGSMENIAGRGVRSTIDGQTVLVGSLKLFQENGQAADDTINQTIEQLERDGRTTMIVGRGDKTLGVIGLADTPRSNVKNIMQRLRSLGIEHLVMLTGDNNSVAQRIANQVGVTEVKADMLPEHKLEAIKTLQGQYGAIAMVGDGVNDAPALATATVGIAMGGAGTAVALETADAALMSDDLGKLPFAVGLSRASQRIIQQNLIIALGVIGLLIVTSVFNIVPLSGAVVLHEGSTLVVVGNAIRLLGYRE
jgi:Cd2+/Zn2+-exporting ATPase